MAAKLLGRIARARGPRERLRTTYKDDRIKDLEALAADADDGLAVGARIVIAAGGIEVLAKAHAAPDSTTSVLVNSAIALRRLLCGAQALGTDQERAQQRVHEIQEEMADVEPDVDLHGSDADESTASVGIDQHSHEAEHAHMRLCMHT